MTEGKWRPGEPLTPLEQRVVAAAALGAATYAGDAAEESGDRPSLDAMQAWGEDRHVRGVVLRHLLVDEEWPVHARGVLLGGVAIVGEPDLEFARLRCPLWLHRCLFAGDEPLRLNHTVAPLLALSQCELAALYAHRIETAADLIATQSTFRGPVNLSDATIHGSMLLSGATLAGVDDDGDSLIADRVHVGGDLLLVNGFSAEGTVRLAGARLDSAFRVADARLAGTRDAVSLHGDHLRVGRAMTVGEGVTTAASVRLLGADIGGRLTLTGSTVGHDADGDAVVADGIRVAGDVLLQPLVTAKGSIRLPGAHVEGDFACRGIRITGHDRVGVALMAERSAIAGNLALRDSSLDGGVRIGGTEVRGQLSLSGGTLAADETGTSIAGEQATIHGDVFLDEGFTTSGALKFSGCVVGGQVTLASAHLGRGSEGNSLELDDARVSGSVFLRSGFTAAGSVRMIGAEIAGQVNLRGAHLRCDAGAPAALALDQVTCGGDLFLDDGFTAEGPLRLRGTHVLGSVTFEDARLTAPLSLYAEGLRVDHVLRWMPAQVAGAVNLERATVHRLEDDPTRLEAQWPAPGGLRLTGFEYESLAGLVGDTCDARLAWLRRQYPKDAHRAEFRSQPYEQLIRVYRQSGQDTDARKVAIGRRNDLRRYGGLTKPRWVWNWLLDKTIKHGYQPGRALILLIVVYAATVGAFSVAQHRGDTMIPTKPPDQALPARPALHCTPRYPCFYPAGYALDLVVPVLDIDQASAWRPDGHAPYGTAFVTATWVATGLGWAFSTLAVLAFTGIIRKE